MRKALTHSGASGGIEFGFQDLNGLCEATLAGVFSFGGGEPVAVLLAAGLAEGLKFCEQLFLAQELEELGGLLDDTRGVVFPELDGEEVARLFAELLADGLGTARR